jgi:hypothetical protein
MSYVFAAYHSTVFFAYGPCTLMSFNVAGTSGRTHPFARIFVRT